MSSAAVWVDPRRMAGQPCIFGTRIPTEQVADLYWYHGLAECVRMWELSRDQVVGAVWFESRYGSKRMRQRFGGWAEENQYWLWSGWPHLPPTKETAA